MAVKYDKLFHMMIDKKISNAQLAEKAGVSANIITRLKRDQYLTTELDGVNWIKIGDTEKNGKYIFSTKEKIKPEGIAKSRYVKSGDFLLTNSMSFGRPYILKTDGCIHDGWLMIGNTEIVFNQDYLYYALSSDFMYNMLSVLAGGSTVDNLNSDLVKSLLFPIPPMQEQIIIANKAESLMEIVDTINNNEKELLKNIKSIKSKILDLAVRVFLVSQGQGFWI